jgi:hypothetical protein
MHVINARNVEEALIRGIEYLKCQGNPEDSRNGPVLVAPGPVATVYHRPTERVLFNEERDANPFFHLIESVWMLAGRDDARLLDPYVSTFSSRYAEDGGVMHGAYGSRWREHFGMDQIIAVGEMLRNNPTTRRAVLTMWDPEVDLGADAKDIPCNTQMYFRATYDCLDKVWELHITVCCRSNDIIWGAYGANAVHMSVLGEVIADLANMRFGTYTQISNNYHAYIDVMQKMGLRPPSARGFYMTEHAKPLPICSHSLYTKQYLAELLLEEAGLLFSEDRETISHPWLIDVVIPVMESHRYYKAGHMASALGVASTIKADDWRMAITQWLERRAAKLAERDSL